MDSMSVGSDGVSLGDFSKLDEFSQRWISKRRQKNNTKV